MTAQYLMLILVVGSALVGGYIANRCRQPLLLGYLAAGLILAKTRLLFNLSAVSISQISEVGLILLMFTIGLNFSFNKSDKLKNIIIVGGIWQIVGTILVGGLSMYLLLGFAWKEALVVAAALCLSSTAIVTKVLEDRKHTDSLSGEIMTGWLLVQDLTAIILVAVVGKNTFGTSLAGELFRLLGIFIMVGATVYVGRRVMPRMADRIASGKSRELLLLFSVLIVFIYAWGVNKLGLSLSLGAFLAGLVLAQAGSHFEILAEIRPFKDVFLAVFFVSLGLTIDMVSVISNWALVVWLVIVLLLIKIVFMAVFLIHRKYHAKTILETSLTMAGVGEFSIVLAISALSAGIINTDLYGIIGVVTIITMILTPYLFNLSGKFYSCANKNISKNSLLYRQFFAANDQLRPHLAESMNKHVVVLGYGRVGRWLVRVLEEQAIDYIVVDYDPLVVSRLKIEGRRAIFGDPVDRTVLEMAGIEKAKLVVVAIPDSLTQKAVVSHSRVLNPTAKIICRTHINADWKDLKNLGADHLIQPEFEAAMAIARQSLTSYGFNHIQQSRIIEKIKRDRDDETNS